LANTDADFDKAKELLFTLLNAGHGELLIRIGAQPPRDKLFARDDPDIVDGWEGVERTDAEVASFKASLLKVVGEIGGKVRMSVFDRTKA
jgi:hypothetical protein